MSKEIANSDFAVAERRKFVAELYFKSVPPAVIFKQYKQQYGLSKHSFDKDITVIRAEVPYSVRENYEQIVDDCMADIDSVLASSLEANDNRTALMAVKQKLDLLKLVNPNKSSVKSVTLNQNNIQLPSIGVDEIRALLGRQPVLDITHKTEDYSPGAE